MPSFQEVIERALNDGKQPSSPEAQEPSNPDASKENTGQAAAAADGKDAATPGEDALLAEPTEEERAQWKPSITKRIQTLSRKVKELAPQAEAYRQIDNYIRAAQLAPKEVVDLFEAGRLLKAGDFDGFLKIVQPHLDLVRQHRGELLPQDIQERLDNGFIDEDSAKELARARLTQDQVKRTQEERDQERQFQERQRTAQAVTAAVQDWEATIRTRDPQYGQKVELVNDRLRVLMAQEGVPQTPEAAVALTRRAYADVTKHLAVLQPTPRPTSARPNGTGLNANGATPRYRDAKEAMLAQM